MNIKRFVGILLFLGLSSISSAQTTVASGNIVTAKYTGDSGTGSFVSASDVHTSLALNSAYNPDYTGKYLLTLSVNVSTSDWSGLENTTIAGYYEDRQDLSGVYSFGEMVTGVSGPYTFTTTLDASALSAKDYIGYQYSDMFLDENQWIQFSANYSITAVPEPSTYALLLGVGTLGLVGWRRFRRK